MNIKALALAVMLAIAGTAPAQVLPPLSFHGTSGIQQSESVSFGEVALILFPVNPILLIENEKFYVGITKEISFGAFPYGRIAAEYSLIFRDTRLNHLRFSYNYDFALEARDLGAVLLSLGGGYFTDFNKEGYFPQVSFGLLFPVMENVAANPYLKLRHTFMTDANESDISDLSLGFGLYIGL